ncbi:tail fiber domain-containing protein [Emticicia sp. C21]|uniref:tail fiber domain-containing protein n=1 Tax=Emticicia sp. C21 TaxID=2302915 RepID=UPI000E3548D4|nr:tail fiber domain-containing protein [Emticicia sp. C21]RFS16887.1 hypothetical protein D0T08_09425 [Emticicia sp. C21]
MKKITLLFITLFIINRVSIAQSVTLATTTANPTKGTVVFNNTSNQLQYWNGSAWVSLTNASGTGWALNATHLYNTNTGNVGIGTSSPDKRFTVRFEGQGITQENNDGTVQAGFYTTESSAYVQTYSNHDLNFSTGNGSAQMRIQVGTGNVAIGNVVPTNRLQIGAPNINGYDFALGNGGGATGISQTTTDLSIVSTTKIILRPSYGNGGYVGINTLTPRGPLDVRGAQNPGSMPFAYFRLNTNQASTGYTTTENPAISIYSQESVLASQFIAISDARIKNIVGISNSAQDLATLRKLEITDYTMKDQLQYGYKPFKKVIAQQVEEVFPQAVTKITDVVPDIYVLAEKVVFDETNKTMTCTLAKSYNVKVGEKLQFIHAKEGIVKAEVIAVSGNSFTVKDWQHPTDKIFVYGREVNDFRSVDYEALSMLGISAIQQLAKENEELKAKNKETDKKFEQLSARLEALEAQLPKVPTGK